MEWNIAPVLLEREELRDEVLEALAAEQPRHPGKRLYLIDCDQLTSADLQRLSGLENLRALSLWGCHGLRNTTALTGFKRLESLDLDLCTGLEGAGAFDGLGGLKDLQRLSLWGCEGLWDTAALADLRQLDELDLTGCSGLLGAAALRGLAGLGNLNRLNLHGCTGLDAEAVREVRGFIQAECEIIGPDGKRVVL